MTSEEQLRARLRKIEALFAGAATPGERGAAEAARTAAPIEQQFSSAAPWCRPQLHAGCRRDGVRAYRD